MATVYRSLRALLDDGLLQSGAIANEPDLERDHRYVYTFSPDAGFAECFACPDNSGSSLAYASGTLYPLASLG